MADFEQLKASVASIIRTNGAEAITGAVLQNVLLTMINSISDGYMFGGVAQHSGSVGNPDYNVFYLGGSGSYTGYGGSIDVPAGSYCVFAYDGTWHQSVIDLGISLGGTVSEGETQGVTGDAVNSALYTLWENITNILDSIEFSDDTSELYKGDRITQGMRVTAGGVERLLSSFTILAATAAKAGLLSAADKRKLDNFVFTVQDMIETMTVSDVTGAGDTGTRIDESIEWTVDEVTHQIATFTLLAATAVKAGLMSNTDKQAVDALFTIEAEDTTAVDDLGVKLTETLNWTVNNVSQIFAEFTLLAATQSKAGLMSAADKAKLDAYENNIRSMEIVDTTGNADKGDQITETLRWVFGGVSTVITTFTLLAATHTKAGLMSAVDKQLVDALLTIIAQDTTAQEDEKASMTQSLKWTRGGTQQTMASFTILAATASKAGLMSAADKAKLDWLASEGYLYAGVATPSGTPVATTGKVFYLAIEAGTYTDYGGIVLAHGINTILYDGSWSFVTLIGFDDEPIDGSHNLLDSGAVKANTLEEKVSDVADSDVAGYLTDKNMKVIAILKKNGAIERLVKNSKDLKIEELENQLSYISSEIDAEGNAVWYLTDSTGKVIAAIDNEGKIQFSGGGGFNGEMTLSKAIEMDAVKVFTDSRNKVIGWITGTGKVHIIELEAEKLSAGNSSDIGVPEQFFDMMAFLANGTEMKKFVNDKSYNLLYSMKKGKYHRDGVYINTVPTILIHDDDTIDYQLPTSHLRDATIETQPTTTTRGGYASILLPIILALNAKHEGEINAENGRITIGLAAEGQRVGLIPLYAHEDVFDGHLNNNGDVVKMISEHEGWDVMCHSMTARYMEANYVVNGLDSEFAGVILANGNWGGDLHWSTTTCYNTADGKNYQIRQDLTGWNELPPAYIKPYCAFSIEVSGQVYINVQYQSEYNAGKRMIINPTYNVRYQVNTWVERAKTAGLPFINAGINWGTSHSVWHMREDLKYIDFFFGRHGECNPVPIDTNAIRFSYAPSASRNGVTGVSHYNVYTEKEYQRLINAIDMCIDNNGLIVFYGHTNDPSAHCNHYHSDLTYPEQRTGNRLNYKDDNYPMDWIVPLKYQYLQDMLNNEDSEYWTIPPLMRRNQDGTLSDVRMESWAEYYPCPGTTEAMLYDVIEYAISKGVRFSTSKEAIATFGNMFNLGVKITYGDQWKADAQLGNIPEENRSYAAIGVDGSFDFNNV